MKTNNQSPRGAMQGSFGKNEEHSPEMTHVGDKKKRMAKRMSFNRPADKKIPIAKKSHLL